MVPPVGRKCKLPLTPSIARGEVGGPLPGDFKVAVTVQSPYFTGMSILTLEMERELESLDP